MSKTKTNLENKIAAATLWLAARQDWDDLTLEQIAKTAKLPVAQIKKHFHDRDDVLPAIVGWVDVKMIAALGKPNASASLHDRLFEILMARVDVLQEHRPAILKFMEGTRRNPALLRRLVPAQAEAMKSVLKRAGLRQKKSHEVFSVAGLLGVYALTLCVWRTDDSPDMSKSMAALDRYLRRAGMAAEIIFRSLP